MPKLDELTGLLDGQNLEHRLEGMLDRADEARESLSLIIADLGGLKLINQSFGRDAGDAVLKAVARTITMCVEDPGLCYRLGGDAFVVLLPGADSGAASRVSDRLRNAIIDSPVTLGTGQRVSLTAFSGVSTYPDDAQTARSLVRAADRRMHAARGATRPDEPQT